MFTDHLGSFERITDERGRLLEKQSFDAWGNRRNPGNWGEIDTRTRRLFARGFTGHEHLDDFGLINMNGRLYDPITTQFLSPDPMREDFPNVSPYAYCAHDPINYTDPTGLYLNVSEATWQGRRSLPSATSSEVLDMRMFIEFQNASMNLMGERHYQWLIHEFFKREVRDIVNYYQDLADFFNKDIGGIIRASTIIEAGVLALLGAESITLTGNALDKIITSSESINNDKHLYQKAINDSRYKNEAFSFDYNVTLEFGGRRAPGDMKDQFLGFWKSEYRDTWKVAADELTWLLRHASVSGTVNVSSNGSIVITHNLSDRFDLEPSAGRSRAYNTACYIFGTGWHSILGASSPNINASWNTRFNY